MKSYLFDVCWNFEDNDYGFFECVSILSFTEEYVYYFLDQVSDEEV